MRISRSALVKGTSLTPDSLLVCPIRGVFPSLTCDPRNADQRRRHPNEKEDERNMRKHLLMALLYLCDKEKVNL